jgi:hypothetical protein
MDTDSRSIFKVATFEHVSKNSSTETTRSQPPSLFLFCSLYTHFPIAHLLGYSNDRTYVRFFCSQKGKKPSIHPPSSPRIYLRDPATDSTSLPEKEPLLLLLPLLHPTENHTPNRKRRQREKKFFFFPFLLSPSSSPSSSPKSTCTTTETGVKGKAVGRDYQRGIISFFSRIVSFFASSWQCATFLMDRQTHKTIHGNGQGDRECVRIRISIDFLPSSSPHPPQKI